MANTGAYPVDPTTDVGYFRIQIGDDTPTTIPDPPDGTAEYEFLSDDAIQAFIDNNETPAEGMSAALGTIGRRLLLQAQDIQVDDIRIRTVERARLFIDHADRLKLGADVIDASRAFKVVPTSVRPSRGPGSGWEYYRDRIG